jgi:polar amino acid transport system substrate-binding protein
MRLGIRLAAAAAIVVAAGAAEAKDWSTIRIAMDATYPPFESLDPSGQIVGFDKDIGDALCAKMQVKCEFINQAWDGIIPGLLANKYDAILSSMSITDERKKQVDFTDKVYNTPPAIAVPKDSKLTGVTPDDLKGITMGAQTSTTHANYAQEKFPQTELKIYPSPDEYKLDLTNGRLDAAIDDVVVLDAWVKSDAGSCCKILGVLKPDPVINGQGAGIAIRKEDSDLREKLNKAIAEIRADGTYKTINAKYFDFDVYGSTS